MNGKNKIATLFFTALFVLGYSSHSAQAAIKDTDVDGLSDDAEINMYLTNPLVFDTDTDGRGDGNEILDGTDPIDAQSSYIEALSRPDPGIYGYPNQWSWYLGRASGILAFILLTTVVSFGLIISSRAFVSFVPGAIAYEVHRFTTWLALGTVIFHFSIFYFDAYLKLKVSESLVPFAMFRDLTTAAGFRIGTAVALGTIAFYCLLILVFTSEFRSKMSPKLWRSIHYISFIAYILFVLHGYMAGTDSPEWWMQALYSASLGLVLLLILVRIVFRNIVPAWHARQKSETDKAETPRES